MREILFRGKSSYNGEWVVGYYFKGDNHNFIISFKSKGSYSIKGNDVYIDPCYNVIPETVGQYTGLTDKSGTKIFEGDILRDDDNEENGVVEFDEGEYFVVFGNVCTHGIDDIARSCYVVGNIHDNPELLKGVDA